MPPTIQILAEKLPALKGVDYFPQLRALKAYIETLSDIEFALEIDRVTNRNIFRYLWSVGLPLRRQSIVALKAKELMG